MRYPREGSRQGCDSYQAWLVTRTVSRVRTRSRRPQERCPLCREELGGPTRVCGGCGTEHHEDCLHELGGCSTLGCVQFKPGLQTAREVPPGFRVPEVQPRSRSKVQHGFRVTIAGDRGHLYTGMGGLLGLVFGLVISASLDAHFDRTTVGLIGLYFCLTVVAMVLGESLDRGFFERCQ